MGFVYGAVCFRFRLSTSSGSESEVSGSKLAVASQSGLYKADHFSTSFAGVSADSPSNPLP